jgi:hypothetical protein
MIPCPPSWPMGEKRTFHILTLHKIEAYDDDLSDFLAEDIELALQINTTRIANDDFGFENLKREYPNYHHYEIIIRKL